MTYPVYPAPAGLFLPNGVLDALSVGVVELEPVYAAHDPATLVRLRYVGANPLAQRLLGLPDPLADALGDSGGQHSALFAFCRDTYWAEGAEAGFFAPGYLAADGTRWQVVAQRHGTRLAVSFTERVARAALAQDPTLATLQPVLAQTPVAIGILRGPEHRFEYVNPAFAQLFANRPLEGLPAAVGLPEASNEGFIAQLDRVYQTGETVYAIEVPMRTAQLHGQPPQQRYFNFTYQAHLLGGHVERLSVFAHDVSE